MSFIINEELESILGNLSEELLGKEAENHIKLEVEYYISNIKKSNEIGYIFLKSIIYIEENIKEINKIVHHTDDWVGLKQQIKLLKLIKDNDLEHSIIFLEKIKNYRDKIAHELDYHPEEDREFLKQFKINNTMSLDDKKMAIVMYFKEIIYGILLIKFGLKNFRNFLILKVD